MKKRTTPKSRKKRHAELKKQIVQRHPGIKEVMEVYNQWKQANKAVQAHQAIKNSGYRVACSDSSDPKLFFQER